MYERLTFILLSSSIPAHAHTSSVDNKHHVQYLTSKKQDAHITPGQRRGWGGEGNQPTGVQNMLNHFIIASSLVKNCYITFVITSDLLTHAHLI